MLPNNFVSKAQKAMLRAEVSAAALEVEVIKLGPLQTVLARALELHVWSGEAGAAPAQAFSVLHVWDREDRQCNAQVGLLEFITQLQGAAASHRCPEFPIKTQAACSGTKAQDLQVTGLIHVEISKTKHMASIPRS